MTKKASITVVSAGLLSGLSAVAAESGQANQNNNEIPIRLYGEPISIKSTSDAKRNLVRDRLYFSIQQYTNDKNQSVELSKLSMAWIDLQNDANVREAFLSDPESVLKSYGMSSRFLAENKKNLEQLRVFMSPKIQSYVINNDYKNLLIELTNHGIISDENYVDLKESFKELIGKNEDIQKQVQEAVKLRDSNTLNLSMAKTADTVQPMWLLLVNIGVAINIAVVITAVVHASMAVSVGVVVESTVPYSHMDKIASLDPSLKQEKDIIFTVTHKSPEAREAYVTESMRRQFEAFLDASEELGLINFDIQERTAILEGMVAYGLENEKVF